MNAAVAALFAAPGLAVGSFLNVVAARLPLKRSLVRPGSSCMSCSTALAARDNIPIVSYLALRGRCRHCGVRISARYLAVEVLTGALVAACGLRFGLTAHAFVAAAFCVVLVVLSAIDLEHRIIPNRIVVPAAAAALVAQTLLEPSVEWVIAGFAAALFLFIAAVAYPRGMGMGDVKLALLLGAVLGRDVAAAIMIGLLAALVPSIFLFATRGSAARRIALPFAPFLALGAVVTLVAGHGLLDWYLGLTR
jgi:leader peptidase (prepilin peptidase)/N-methyltransferase